MNMNSLIDHNQHLPQQLTDPPISRPPPKAGVKRGRSKKIPLEEALKMELTTNNMKTPKTALQELLNRGITPQYNLIQVEGAVHEPTFRYRVSYQDKDAMGTGKSKKEAKHAAARALIDKLAVTQENLANHNTPGGEEEPSGNPIVWLQKMCIARSWPSPLYEMEMEEVLPHERQFTIACVVLKYHEVGEGKSKKIAKRQAAQKMWQRLQDQPLEPSQTMQLLDDDGNEELRPTGIGGRFADPKDAGIPSLTTAHSQKVSHFHKALKSRSGEALTKLKQINLNDRSINFKALLDDIANEQRFEVTYVDIDEKTHSGMYQCLLQLSTLPVAVCHGTGKTILDAQMHAARNSLEYLKIMPRF
ncbi:RISC-loading complex subunit tarbp2-like [Anopheles ziemanni]|uniref:RISC-loading complex subunit tarbp2-like n=1 Tax=Anopheles ziemanni TaxID=345580 RepID=UPI00265EFBF4|nr:RISC-loading complex subunit tarbp2-like [Anopheles ziemanni]